jgi:SAM-dependent methyltransferase
MLKAPPLTGLELAAVEVLHLAREVEDGRKPPTNTEGGDVGGSGSRRSLVRHVANYLAAAELVELHDVPAGHLVDVGAGVGTLTAWLARRLARPAHLVDADPAVRATATRAYPGLLVHADLSHPPLGSAAVVTAMEVIEHIPPAGQHGFVRGLLDLLRPGGLLVVSTPDESSYLGGWSGYAPHVGVLDADGVRDLLAGESGQHVQVWRMEGEAFTVGPARRVLQPIGNRVWGAGSAGQRHGAARRRPATPLRGRPGPCPARTPSPAPAAGRCRRARPCAHTPRTPRPGSSRSCAAA